MWALRFRTMVITAAIAAVPVHARAACTIIYTASLAFGTYDPFSATPLDTTGSVWYTCTNSPGVTITVNTGSSGSYSQRTMRSGANTLGYNVYIDAARTMIWGDGTPPSVIGPGATTNFLGITIATLYGRVPAGQDAVAGTFSDTLVLSVNF